MKQHEFREIGQRLYGDKWFKRMAHELGVTVHTVREMANNPTKQISSYLAKSVKNLDRLGDDYTRKTMDRLNRFLDGETEITGKTGFIEPSYSLDDLTPVDGDRDKQYPGKAWLVPDEFIIKCNQPEKEDNPLGMSQEWLDEFDNKAVHGVGGDIELDLGDAHDDE